MRIFQSRWKRQLDRIAVGDGCVAAGNGGYGPRDGGLEVWAVPSGEVTRVRPRGERVHAVALAGETLRRTVS